jgi:hypothetical protein
MLWVNIFLSLRSLRHARHSFSDKKFCFLPITGHIVYVGPFACCTQNALQGAADHNLCMSEAINQSLSQSGTGVWGREWLLGHWLPFQGLLWASWQDSASPGGKAELHQCLWRAADMTRPINYLIEVLSFEDEKCCVSGECCGFQWGVLYQGSLVHLFKVSSSLWWPSLASSDIPHPNFVGQGNVFLGESISKQFLVLTPYLATPES